MSKIKEYIAKIVDNGKREDMECLSDMLDELICDMKENHPEEYKKYKNKLFGMANNYTFDSETAQEIVEKMKPYGEHWNIDETNQVKNQYGLNKISNSDFYLVMNSAYNDYNDLFGEDLESYVKFSVMFIEDDDARKDKVWFYYNEIPKN